MTQSKFLRGHLRACSRVRHGATVSLVAMVFIFTGLLSATVNSGEIIPSSVTATVGNPGAIGTGTTPGGNTPIDPVNGVSVTFKWTTLHPSNSIIVIQVPGEDNPTRQVADNSLTTSHKVVVDHFPAATATYSYYVVSKQSNGTWATYPGPVTQVGCSTPAIPACGGTYNTFTVSAYNASGSPIFTLWPVGAKSVYQGDAARNPSYHDLYVALNPNLLSGPTGMVTMQNATVINLATGQAVSTITPVHLCALTASSNPPPSGWDGNYYGSGQCWNANYAGGGTYLRLRVSANAVPGQYKFTANFQAGSQPTGAPMGSAVPVSWTFTVLPTAAFIPTPPTSSPVLAGLAAWQSNMANPTPYPGSGGTPYRSGEWWCTNNQQTSPNPSLDNADYSGIFDISYSYGSNQFRSVDYDGGRVYQQIADYDYNTPGMPGYQNPAHNSHWKRCAQAVMDPFKNDIIATQGAILIEPYLHPYGLEMNYLRTGDSSDLQAVKYTANGARWGISYAYVVTADSTRITSYILDSYLAAEMAGQPRNTAFLPRTVDIVLGYMDQLRNLNFNDPNNQQFNANPYMFGAAMEALINYYELDLVKGNIPDARIPLEIKKTLDWLASSANAYIPSRHTTLYSFYDLPRDPNLVGGMLFEATELNDLLAPAYAWYWSQTGDAASLATGDDLFNHVFDSASFYNPYGYPDNGWTWGAKEFNQVYKWSFDFVRWRTLPNANSTVIPALNPCENASNPCNAPWPDLAPPIQFLWKPSTGIYSKPTINNFDSTTVTVTSTSATFTFNTYKPATAQVRYGTATPAACVMQPYPNFGLQACLAKNYAGASSPTVGVYNSNTANQYDKVGSPNIYNYTVTITGLTPNTRYHWRPLLTDFSGNTAAYMDQTFTTTQ